MAKLYSANDNLIILLLYASTADSNMPSFALDKLKIKRVCKLKLSLFIFIKTFVGVFRISWVAFLICVSMMADHNTFQQFFNLLLQNFFARIWLFWCKYIISFFTLKVLVYDGLIGEIFYMVTCVFFRWISIRISACQIILMILVGLYMVIVMFLFFTWILILGIESVCIWLFVCEVLVTNFERLDQNRTLAEKSWLRTYDIVNLAHLFHHFDVIELDICWNKIDIPHCEICMKIDCALHRKFSQIRHVRHEACKGIPVFLFQDGNSVGFIFHVLSESHWYIEQVERQILKN